MQRTLYRSLLAILCLCGSAEAAKDILLRTAPEASAPVIAKVTATEKVILDAAPAPRNAESGWRQLALPTPFEGYVPIAEMDKNFVIVHGTSVRYLPTENAAEITRVEAGDAYEVVRATDEWATVRFRKDITGYFQDETAEAVELDFASLQVPLVETRPAAEPAATPVAIPAVEVKVNPDEPISQLDPKSLPPENVIWKPATRLRGNEGESERASSPATSPSPVTDPTSRITNPDLMVTPGQTQAREPAPELGPAKTPRLLTGLLKQRIESDGAYPMRLHSPEGRFIAYVDFSGIYISDLSPFLDQKVYIRGQVHPLPGSSAQLVILAESIRLGE